MALPTRRSLTLSWTGLLFYSGLAAFVALAVFAVTSGDLEAGMVAFGFGLSLGLLRFRRGGLGRVGIGLLSAIMFFFMVTAAVTNVRSGSPVGAVLLSGGLASIAFAGLVSAIVVQANRQPTMGHDRSPWYIAGASVVLFLGLWGWSLASSDPSDPAADAMLVAKNVAFSSSTLSMSSGDVTVSLANQDLFWHTFTIDNLGVDLPVPVGATRSVTFTVTPGTYEFECRIPGHPEAGMVGTLTVR